MVGPGYSGISWCSRNHDIIQLPLVSCRGGAGHAQLLAGLRDAIRLALLRVSLKLSTLSSASQDVVKDVDSEGLEARWDFFSVRVELCASGTTELSHPREDGKEDIRQETSRGTALSRGYRLPSTAGTLPIHSSWLDINMIAHSPAGTSCLQMQSLYLRGSEEPRGEDERARGANENDCTRVS